jgi:hypothetical protein
VGGWIRGVLIGVGLRLSFAFWFVKLNGLQREQILFAHRCLEPFNAIPIFLASLLGAYLELHNAIEFMFTDNFGFVSKPAEENYNLECAWCSFESNFRRIYCSALAQVELFGSRRHFCVVSCNACLDCNV